jgi:small subunit ribosomal protein S6
MNSYEGMFIFKPDLTKDGLDRTLGQVREIIEKQKGSIDEIKEWAKQKLAYPIKKHKEGLYHIINFHIDPEAISNIKRSFGLNEAILRVMIVGR